MAKSQPLSDLDECAKLVLVFVLDKCIIPPMIKDYKKSLEAAIQELSTLMEREEKAEAKLEEIRGRVRVVRQGIYGLARMCNAEPEFEYPHLFPDSNKPDVGFTDAVREVLRSHTPNYLSPVGVRNELQDKGFDLAGYKNPLASIHTILKRLEKMGQAEILVLEGTAHYTWKRGGVKI